MGRRTEAEFAEKRAAAYAYRVRGLTYREIAAAMGVPMSTVHYWCKDLVAARVEESQTEVMQYELDRLDRYIANLDLQLEQQIASGKSAARTVEVLAKLGERRAKLLGLDAPEKVQATVTEITQADVEAAELVNEAKARAAAEVDRIRAQVSS